MVKSFIFDKICNNIINCTCLFWYELNFWIEWWSKWFIFNVMLNVGTTYTYSLPSCLDSHTELLFNRVFIMQCSISFDILTLSWWYITSIEPNFNQNYSPLILSSQSSFEIFSVGYESKNSLTNSLFDEFICRAYLTELTIFSIYSYITEI